MSGKEPRRLAIGDIHGCWATFRAMVEHELCVSREDELVLIGDYIDRGPESRAVLDYIMELSQKGFNVIKLRGNHEQMCLDAIDDSEKSMGWLWQGGDTTLASFGVLVPDRIPAEYVEFLRSTRMFYLSGDDVLVHAGIDDQSAAPLGDPSAMLYSRKDPIDVAKSGFRRLINGHTPHTKDEIEQQPREPRIHIDCGCVYKGRRHGLGYLCGYDLDLHRFYFAPNIDF